MRKTHPLMQLDSEGIRRAQNVADNAKHRLDLLLKENVPPMVRAAIEYAVDEYAAARVEVLEARIGEDNNNYARESFRIMGSLCASIK